MRLGGYKRILIQLKAQFGRLGLLKRGQQGSSLLALGSGVAFGLVHKKLTINDDMLEKPETPCGRNSVRFRPQERFWSI